MKNITFGVIIGFLLALLFMQQCNRAIIYAPPLADTLKVVSMEYDTLIINKNVIKKQVDTVLKDKITTIVQHDTIIRYKYIDDNKLYRLDSRISLAKNNLPVFEYSIKLKKYNRGFLMPRIAYNNNVLGIGIQGSYKGFTGGIDVFTNLKTGIEFGYQNKGLNVGMRMYPEHNYFFAGIRF